jgi:hypothetical protein
VPAATAQGTVFVPGIGAELILDPSFTRTPDRFAQVAAGLEYARPLSSTVTLIGGAELRQRMHSDLDGLDVRSTDLNGAVQHRLNGRDSVQYSVRYNDYDLDQASYRRVQSAAVQWSRNFGLRARVSLTGQGARIRYLQDDVQSSSSDLVGVGISAVHLIDEATRTIGLAGISAGHDNAVSERADGDRRLYGLTLGLQRRLLERLEGFVAASLLYSDYDQRNASFDVTRRDRQRDLAVGLTWNFAAGWSLRPQVARTSNRSNLPLADYTRTETSLTLRHTWD